VRCLEEDAKLESAWAVHMFGLVNDFRLDCMYWNGFFRTCSYLNI
jgi:hypothetical protein